MRILTLRKTPARFEVFVEVSGFLDGGDESLVNLLLVGSPGFREGFFGFGFALLKELGLC